MTAVVIDAVRTPVGKGKPGGSLAGTHPADLLSTGLQALLSRSDLDPALRDDVIGGCVWQVPEQATNVTRGFRARTAHLAAGDGQRRGAVNPRGGAIALGHALGSTGTRLLTTMLTGMPQRQERRGLQTVCEGGGMANAMIVERV